MQSSKIKLQGDLAEAMSITKALEKNLVDLQSLEEAKSLTYERALDKFTKASDAYIVAKQSHTLSNDNVLAQLRNKHALLLQHAAQLRDQYNKEKERKEPNIDVDGIKQRLTAIEAQTPVLEKNIRILTNYLSRLSWWQKAFGAGGLKAYVFSAELNRLNSCLSPYTQYFGMSIVFGIDLTKQSKPFYCKVTLDGEHEVDYDSLSGGQRQKVDLVINFAIQDASESITSFNISILDEPETGLDSDTLEVLDTLLKIRSEHKAIYIITHYQLLDLSGATTYDISGGLKGLSVIS